MENRPTVREPQQQRSRDTLERLLQAAREIVGEVGFDQASISAITQRAGVASGTFYTRFENKDALLQALHEEQTSNDIERLESGPDLDPERSHTVRELLTHIVTASLALTRSIAGFQRACYQRALTDPDFAARELAVRTALHARIGQMLEGASDEIGHPDPARAADFCAELYVAVVTEHVNAEAFNASGLSDDELAHELVDAMCAYLRVT